MAVKAKVFATNERIIDHYSGQPKLRNYAAIVEYSEEEVVEIAACMQDPLYFIETYCYLVHPDEGLMKFIPYDYQKKIVETVTYNRYTICKLPRQAGKTAILAAILAWHAIFQPHQTIACLAHKEAQAIEVLDRVKIIIENLPKWLQQGVVSWAKKAIVFENGSEIFASATGSGTIRGRTITMLYLDEFAFVPTNLQEEFYISVLPTIAAGRTTKIVITSTPKGFNLFHKIWDKAVKKTNEYIPIEINWNDPPGRDEAWREKQIGILGSEEKFNQEYNADFIGSSATLIRPATLAALTWMEPINYEEPRFLSIFENPEPGKPYILAVDSSDGVNRDFSSFVVFDVSTIPYKVVATYRNNRIEPLLYPDVIWRVGKFYNNAWIVAENNNMGQQVINVLHYDFEYENIFSTSKELHTNEVMEGSDKRPGVRTTKKTKRIGCSNLKTLLENNQLVTNDHEIMNELSRFVKYKDSYRAEEGSHDDLVMCMVFFAWLTTQPYFKDLTNTDMRLVLQKQRVSEITEALMPFGIIDTAQEEDSEFLDLTNGGDFDAWLRNA